MQTPQRPKEGKKRSYYVEHSRSSAEEGSTTRSSCKDETAFFMPLTKTCPALESNGEPNRYCKTTYGTGITLNFEKNYLN